MATIESATEIRPVHVEVAEEDLDDLRGRIAATRWPEKRDAECRWPAQRPDGTRRRGRGRVRRGGSVAAWEQPQLFTAELRAAFRPLCATDAGSAGD